MQNHLVYRRVVALRQGFDRLAADGVGRGADFGQEFVARAIERLDLAIQFSRGVRGLSRGVDWRGRRLWRRAARRRRGYVDFGQRLLGISIGGAKAREQRKSECARPSLVRSTHQRRGRAASRCLLSVIRSSRQKYCAASRGHVGSMANVIYAETISSIAGGVDWKPCKSVLFATIHIYYDVALLTLSGSASLELFHFQ